MSLSRLTLSAVAVSFLATAALAEGTSTQPASTPAGDHHMMRGMFTREERIMRFADMFRATAGMTDDQKKEYRQQK